jgi:hypothetical protein
MKTLKESLLKDMEDTLAIGDIYDAASKAWDKLIHGDCKIEKYSGSVWSLKLADKDLAKYLAMALGITARVNTVELWINVDNAFDTKIINKKVFIVSLKYNNKAISTSSIQFELPWTGPGKKDFGLASTKTTIKDCIQIVLRLIREYSGCENLSAATELIKQNQL